MKRLITILLAINMLLSICLSADMGAQLGIDRTALTANAAVDTSFYSVGDTISFGHYEQDCNTSNGAESIEWTVIDKTDSTLLLISKHALLDRQYNIDYVASNPDLWRCTWETCKLRAFLNSDFYFSAFSTDERSHIRLNYLSNPGNPDYGTKGGNDTSDYVYILSQEELNTYMPNASSRKAFPTKSAAAVKPGALKLEIASDGSCHWWLRTPGKHAGNAQYVRHGNGHLVSDGSDVGHVLGVRPVICIQAEAIKQTESVTLSADTLTVKGTEAVSLTATITPANSGSPTRWSSSNTKVATVNATSGAITVVAPGTTTITVTSGDFSDSCTLTVKPGYTLKAEGGSVRVSTPYGLRFGIKLLKDDAYNKFKSSIVTYGTLIIPKSTLGDAELTIDTPNVMNIKASNIYSQDSTQITYTGVLVGIPKTSFTSEIVGRGYLTYKDADGTQHTIYTDTIVRSYSQVAVSAFERYEAIENRSKTEQAVYEKLKGIIEEMS